MLAYWSWQFVDVVYRYCPPPPAPPLESTQLQFGQHLPLPFHWYNGMGIVKISYWYLNDMGSYHILCMSGLKDLESSLRVCSRVASSSYLKIKIEQYQLFDQMHHRAASIFETYDSTPVANQQEEALMTKRRPSQFIWCSNHTNLTRNQVKDLSFTMCLSEAIRIWNI